LNKVAEMKDESLAVGDQILQILCEDSDGNLEESWHQLVKFVEVDSRSTTILAHVA
jgi:hypothetical protein